MRRLFARGPRSARWAALVPMPVLLLAMLVPLAPATARPEAIAYGEASQTAWADWIRIRGDTGTFYFAIATRGANTFAGPFSVAYVGKGTCEVTRGKRFTMVACGGSARGHDLALDEFQMDPLMRSATLRFGKGRRAQEVVWTAGDGAPQQGAGLGFGAGYVDLGGGAYRWAPAKGRLFGQRLKPGGPWHFGVLEQGGWGGGYVSGDAEARLRPDGTLEVSRTIRIPR